jgi:hypothetical protein
MKTARHYHPLIAAACLVTPFLLAPVWAASGDSVTDEDLLLARSPIIIKTRLTLGNEFTDLDDGGHRDKLVLGGIYGFGFNQHDRDLAIGFELPMLYNDPVAGGDDWGVGDFKLRLGQLLADEPGSWRAGWFFDTEFDTAADDVRAIANQRNQMSFGGGVSYPVWGPLTLSSRLQYGWSLNDGDTTGRKSEWEGHVTASAKISSSVSLNLDYKAVLNEVGNDEVFNTLEPSIGWTVRDNLGLYAAWELPLDSASTDWVAKAGLIWFF